jgi:hypothetical protein
MKPQLTIRDLFWLVLVAALVTAWWLDRRTLRQQIEKLSTDLNVQQWLYNSNTSFWPADGTLINGAAKP